MRGIERYEWRTEHWPEEQEAEAAHVQRPRPAKGHQDHSRAKKGVKMRNLAPPKTKNIETDAPESLKGSSTLSHTRTLEINSLQQLHPDPLCELKVTNMK